MKITDKIIMEASTGGTGAWTSASFRALGLKWPQKHGWKKYIKSQDYTDYRD